jgi:hypothetical protein
VHAGLDLHPALLALMAKQGGVFSGAQALAHGHNRSDLQRLRTRAPRVLMSLRRGAYVWRESYESATPEARHRLQISALALRVEGPAVVSHHSAAVVLGLPLLDPDLDVVHLTRCPPSQPRTEAGVRHHVAELPEEMVVPQDVGLPVTSLARTAVDVARETDRLECAVAAFDSALRCGVTRAQLESVFETCRNWPGARHVARAIRLADGRAENPGESWSRVVLIQEGLPPDDLQVPVRDDEGFVGYADFGWKGVVGEFDGKGKYGLGPDTDPDPESVRRILWKEKRREDRLRVRNEVVRWGAAELHHPAVLAGRVRAAQERAWHRAGGFRTDD